MRGMKEFTEGHGPRPKLSDATGTERRIHTYLVLEEDSKSVEQIVKALSLDDDPPRAEGAALPPGQPEPRTAAEKVQAAIRDLGKAGLVRGDASGGYTGVSP